MNASYKSKLIQQHIEFCKRNGIALDQVELNRMYTVPYRFLKKFIMETQSKVMANA